MSLIILDRQHRGRASKPKDAGAAFKGYVEADLVERYIAVATQELKRLGHRVEVLLSGEYGSRHVEAIALAKASKERCLYVACHVNAGGGRYALVEHDSRSKGGAAAAAIVAREFALRLAPEVNTGKVVALGSADRGFACIDGIYAGPANLSAVLFEPGFIDSSQHAGLWTTAGLSRIGVALAAGCDAWGRAA